MIQFGVVQNRGMFIQRHDVAVRHVGIAVAGRRQVSLIDIELAHTGLERFVRRTVAIHRRFLRFTHAVKFVVGLVGAIVVQIIQHAFRVEFICRNIQTQRALRNRTNVADVAARRWQLAAYAVCFWQRNHVNFFGPE